MNLTQLKRCTLFHVFTQQVLRSTANIFSPDCLEYQQFEKFNLTDPYDDLDLVINFPLSREEVSFLRNNSRSTSVMLEDQCVGTSLKEVKKELANKNLFPPPKTTDIWFWELFKEVLDVQIIRKENGGQAMSTDPLPHFMPYSSLPDLWKEDENFSIDDVAEAVFDEFPGIYHSQMLFRWLKQKTLVGNDIIPKTGNVDFLRGPVMLSDMIGLAIRLVGDCNFVMKWQVGRPRPEEIAIKIKLNELCVPAEYEDYIVPKIMNMVELDESLNRFTAYPEGSPTHPAWPAMHSAASAASFWLDVVMDLTEEQLCEARKLDYAIAFARTVAGVHYTDDNLAGLVLGMNILKQRLPTELATIYGSNKAEVRTRCNEKMYDWTKFNQTACYLGTGTGF